MAAPNGGAELAPLADLPFVARAAAQSPVKSAYRYTHGGCLLAAAQNSGLSATGMW
jgi:hypothetical protein